MTCFYGVYPAIVAKVGDPSHPGEVRLRFDWYDPQMETESCRICNLYAGNGYGSVWHPEKDDEVLVAFMHGDMRFPIVLGGLYNGKDAPPTARSDKSDQKLLRTKGGHELLMDDTESSKRVRLKSAGNHSVDIDDHGKQIVITTEGGNQVTLDANGAKITLKTSGGQSITLESGSIKLAANKVVIEATSIKLGGDSATQSLVLGEALMMAYNLHTHNCTAPGAPSGPPLSPMTPSVLSQTSKTA